MSDGRVVARAAWLPWSALLLVVVFVAAAGVGHRQAWRDGVPYDDAFITLRYAQNLAEGRGLVWNPGERVNSASSFLHTAVLAAAFRLGARDLERATLWVGLAAGCVASVLLARIIVARTGDHLLALAFGAPVVGSVLAGWSVSGMETSLACALVLGVVDACVRERRREAWAWMALAALCRPEAALVAVAALAACGVLTRSNAGVAFAGIAVTGAVVVVAVAVASAAYYHDWVPQPVTLKRLATYYSPGPGPQALDLYRFLSSRYAVAAVLSAGGLAIALRKAVRVRRGGEAPRYLGVDLMLGCAVALGVAALVIGPRSDHHRYAAPFMLLMAASAAIAFSHVPRQLRSRLRPVLLAGIAALSLLQARDEFVSFRRDLQRWSAHQSARIALGRWLEANLSPGDAILTSDAGAIGYAARSHRVLDAFGLLSREPLDAARSGNWNHLDAWLGRERPVVLADTRGQDGSIQCLNILRFPGRYFRGAPADRGPAALPRLESIPNGPDDFVTGDGYGFIARRCSWSGLPPFAESRVRASRCRGIATDGIRARPTPS